MKNFVFYSVLLLFLSCSQDENLKDLKELEENKEVLNKELEENLNQEKSSVITICKSSPFPSGYVIVGQATNFSCSSSINNAWRIKRPGNRETICKSSPFPDGYVIVGQATNFSCSSRIDNAWRIKIPGRRETICKSSPLPSGYVIVGEATNFSCSSRINNSWRIRRY
ncbi:hypothetical protein [Aquimarina aquimarini]|uniref:hypothetical protein n=1 Tax=Aquimarina aquimarini TaxID=1191734 RepID=UPI001F29E4A4|nr:hypothetical protein [Aquimarina aquimarini]